MSTSPFFSFIPIIRSLPPASAAFQNSHCFTEPNNKGTSNQTSAMAPNACFDAFGNWACQCVLG